MGRSRLAPLGPRLAHGCPLPAGMAPTPTARASRSGAFAHRLGGGSGCRLLLRRRPRRPPLPDGAGPRRGCCRPWGRRAASDRFNAPPTFDSARRIGGPLRHRGRLLLWTDPAGRGAGAEPTDIPRAFFFGSGSLRGLVLFRLVGPGLLMVVAGAL